MSTTGSFASDTQLGSETIFKIAIRGQDKLALTASEFEDEGLRKSRIRTNLLNMYW